MGLYYLEALDALHKQLAPKTYLEIGTSRGDSLALAQCLSVAIDPAFTIDKPVVGTKPELHMLRTGSAEAFARGQVKMLLPTGADFCFIDGLHLIEAVLQDFVGCEAHARPTSTIAIHDILPINTEMAARDGSPNRKDQTTKDWWTGDVWKIIPILAQHRPDLKMSVLDCQPTGLLLVRGLNPGDRTLAGKVAAIIAEWRDVTLEDYGLERLYGEAAVHAARTPADISAALHVRR